MSLRKERLSWVFIGLFLLVVAATVYWVILPQLQSRVTLRVGDGVFAGRVLKPQESIAQAQRDVQALRPGAAIMHVYLYDALWTIDTKHRTALFDFVWLDKDKKVVHIVKNASMESRPDTLFAPKVLARYIIELRGGTVDEKAIRIDNLAVFDEIHLEGAKR